MIIRVILLFISLSVAFLSVAAHALPQKPSYNENEDVHIDLLKDIFTECENQERLKFSYETKLTVFPAQNKYCYISTQFYDHLSANDAIANIEKKFTHLVAMHSGKTVAGIFEIKNGRYMEDIYITVYAKSAKTTHKVIKRWVGKNDNDVWNITVGFRAEIERHRFENDIKYILKKLKQLKGDKEGLNRFLAHIRSEAQNLRQNNETMEKKIRELDKKLREQNQRSVDETVELRMEIDDLQRQLAEANQKYQDQKDWYAVAGSFNDAKGSNTQNHFKRFCNSTNETVKKLCERRRLRYFEDKRHIKEFIEYAKIAVSTGKATPNLYNKLGVAIWMSRDGSLQEAQNYFELALKHHDLKNDELRKKITYNLATILGHLGKYTEAITYLNDVENRLTLDPAGRVLRATLRSRESQTLICNDLRLACGNNENQQFCENWERAKQIGDCSETVTPLDKNILQSNK